MSNPLGTPSRHDFWEDPFVGVDLCGECGAAREARIHHEDFVPKPPAPVRAGVRGQPDAAGCGVLLAGLGLFVAGAGFGALYLVAVIREVF